jgi:hypothetical protein
MDLSDKKNYVEYTSETNLLIENKIAIGNTDMYLRKGEQAQRYGFLFQAENQYTVDEDVLRQDHARFDFKKNLDEIRENEYLNNLIIIGHINDDRKPGNENGTGLVAYAFQKEETNEICFLCRGSEGGIFSFVPDWVEKIEKRKWTEIFKSEDWQDNFNMIFQDSTNFEPLKNFALGIISEYGDSDTHYSVYGHSKGGGLAIYLAALFENMEGAAVDGVGLPVSTYMENVNFIAALRKSKLRNIIADNDIVGKMLIHYEKRVFVRMYPIFANERGGEVNPNEPYAFTWAHYPDAILTDENGMVVISNKKRFLPSIVGIINNVLMMMVLYEKLSEAEKTESKAIMDSIKEKSIKLLDLISY